MAKKPTTQVKPKESSKAGRTSPRDAQTIKHIDDFAGGVVTASLKQRDPQLEERQRQGRNLLWDRPQDRQAQQDFNESRVAQQAYVYHTKG